MRYADAIGMFFLLIVMVVLMVGLVQLAHSQDGPSYVPPEVLDFMRAMDRGCTPVVIRGKFAGMRCPANERGAR